MQFALITFLFGICIYEIVKKKNLLNPIFIFNFIWLLTIVLYELKLSYLQQDLSSRTILIFWISVIVYNVICFIFLNSTVKEKLKTKINIFRIPKVEIIQKIKSIFLSNIDTKIKIAKWIAIIIFIVEIIYSKGLPLIWKMTGNSKTYFDFGITSLNGAWYGLIICLGAYSFFSKSKNKYLYLAMGILILSRQVIMSIILEAIIFNILDKSKKIDVKKYIIIALVVFLGFNVLGNIRSGSDEMNKVFKAKEQYENIPTSIKWVYSYMTFSISNFNNLVNQTYGGVNNGISTLDSFLPNVVLNKLHLEKNFQSNFLVSGNFTVSTYLPPLYLDYGLVGVAIFNGFIALIGAVLYNKVVDNNSIKNRLLYAVFAHNIVFLFFTNMFLYLPIMIQIVYIFIIFNEKKNKKEEKGRNMNENELVSVVIPTYNRAQTIKRSIMSVLNQTYKNIEIIVVDDCSTDKTKDIIDEIKDDRVKYFKLEKNSGACVARNYGIEKSKGNYIAFQDSDDEWYENKLEIQMQKLLNSNNDLVFCSLNRVIEGKSNVTKIPEEKIDCSKNFTHRLLLESCISTQTVLAKKYIFNNEKFDPRLPRFQDWDLMIRISKKFKIDHIDIPLLNLYIQKDSITRNPKKALIALKIIYEKNKEEIESDKNLIYQFKKKEAKFLFENQEKCKKELKEVLKIKFDIKIFIYYLSYITGTNKLLLKIKN